MMAFMLGAAIMGCAPDPPGQQEFGVASGLPSWLGAIGVEPKSSWGGETGFCDASRGPLDDISIHHTVTARSVAGAYDASVRAIQDGHLNAGWCDVGYHFLIAEDGTVFEGRRYADRGAAVADHNAGNVAVAFVGCFEPGQCDGLGGTDATQAMITAAGTLAGSIAKREGLTVTTQSLMGHWDYAHDTACPGTEVYSRLGEIRTLASAIQTDSAPCDATFYDVCDVPFRASIEWLAAAGAVGGCSADGTLFCPYASIKRADMASMLTRLLSLPVGPDVFDDDAGHWAESAINAVAAAGLLNGCGAHAFCPRSTLTRGEMAAIITRLLSLPAGPDAFADDDGSPFEIDINAVAAAGISSGCAPGRFCPDATLKRGEAAALLQRATDVL